MKRLVLLSIILMLVQGIVNAQTRQVSGTITDTTGSPLGSATILTDNKKAYSAVTRPDGSYTITVDKNTRNLIVSSVGYTTQSFPLTASGNMDVALHYAVTNTLEDVVVIGYGTQKKSHLTGSVSKYANDRIDEIPVSRLDQALQGRIAGVAVQNLSPEAGSTPRIRVRGLSSINASADPLVVVDGHPVPDGLAFVNMADVQSVEVLKDAASAAIYGSRGSAGVIIVTTKSGRSDKTKYNAKISTGWRSAYELQDMMTVTEYTNLLFAEAAKRATDPTVPTNQQNRITTAERAQYIIEQTIFGGQPHDWQAEAIQDAAQVSNVQINVSGGTKTLKYFISGGYNKDEGIMYHSNYEKASVRMKFETQLGKRVKFNLNINPTYSTRERPSVGYIDFVRFPSFLPAYHNAASAAFTNQLPQWASIRPGDFAQVGHFNGRIYTGLMPDGTTYTGTSAVDPFSSSNNTPKSVMETRTITQDDYRLISSGDLTINLMKGLDFKTLGSFYISQIDGIDFAQTNSNRQGDVNRGSVTKRLNVDLLSENTLNYTTAFGKHSISALAGFTAQKTTSKIERIEATGFPSENINTINTALQIVAPGVGTNGDLTGTYTYKSGTGLLSYLGRIQYSYNDRYLISASMRRDGSSQFAPGHKWGNFPAVSAGWVVTKEKFMNNISWLNHLKLRGSYGVTGNNRIQGIEFAWLDLLYNSAYVFGSGTGTTAAGLVPNQNILANINITWERTFQNNLGIDLGLFNNALSLTAEYYNSKTEKLILNQAAMTFTGARATVNNIGRVQNKGVEIELTSNNVRHRNFKWTTTANFASNRNKLLEFGGENLQFNTGERNEVYMTQIGFPAVRFWGYKTDGVWLSQAEADLAKAKDQGTANATVYYTAGGLRIVDINGDNKISIEDRTEIGNPFPDFTWGLNNSLSYKNWDLSFLFQGVQGVDVFNGDGFYNESRKYNKKYNDGNRWVSAANPGDGKTPYFTTGFDWLLTDYLIEDGSYFALRDVILGYKLPERWTKRVGLSGARFYASAQNLWIKWASDYRGINPEARSTSGNYASPLIDGYQRGSFPMQRTFLFGIDINF